MTIEESSDENLGNEVAGPDQTSRLEKEFVRPSNSYTWKGFELWPLCNGGELLFQQVIDRNDSNLTVILIWIFIHLKRGGKDAAEDFEIDRPQAGGYKLEKEPGDHGFVASRLNISMIELAWDKVKFRGAFLRWLDSLGQLSLDDKNEAVKVFDEAHGWSAKSAVVPVPEVGQKKRAAKSPKKSLS